MRIYACDDEQLMLTMLEKAILEASPEADLKTFSKSADLLEYARDNKPDVVFLDIHMPGQNGLILARELMGLYPKLNVIFVTGHSEYAGEAFNIYASGYINKPVNKGQIKEQLARLRYNVGENTRFFAQTFGNFTLFADGEPLQISRTKSKEILAYLVDRNGAEVSRRELGINVFEDENFTRETQKYLSGSVRFLEETLSAADASEILIHSPKGYSVDKAKLNADLFDFLEGRAPNAYHGEYMEQYSWGENFKGMHYSED